MAVIKHINADRVADRAVVLNLGDLNHEAERILDRARAEAGRLLADAQAEAKQIVDEASEKGRIAGHAEGVAQGLLEGHEQGKAEALVEYQDRLQTLEKNWSTAIERWEVDRRRMLVEAKEDVLSFAFALAKKIAFRTIEQQPETIQSQLESALKMLTGTSAAAIVIHPDDRALVEEVLPQTTTSAANADDIEIIEDVEQNRGGCMVRTAGGEIDARIETQLNRIAEALLPPSQKNRFDTGEIE